MACKTPEVASLVQEAKDTFQKVFGEAAQVAAVAPGRVNIIGEHTDYNDGFVFPMVSDGGCCYINLQEREIKSDFHEVDVKLI